MQGLMVGCLRFYVFDTGSPFWRLEVLAKFHLRIDACLVKAVQLLPDGRLCAESVLSHRVDLLGIKFAAPQTRQFVLLV